MMDPGVIVVPWGTVGNVTVEVPPAGGRAKEVVQGLRVIGAMVLTGLTPGLTTGLTPVLPSPGFTVGCVRYSMVGEISESSGIV
jgi:hypothetical protein